MDDFHVSIAFPWERACAAANAANLQKVFEVLPRTLRRRSEETIGNPGRLSQLKPDGQDIYIRSEPKEGKYPIKKDDISRL